MKQLSFLPPVEQSEYRYTLTRKLGADTSSGDRLLWIMLNPSTADDYVDDPTIRRIMRFSAAWGYVGLDVVNVFALRATDPAELRKHRDPVGPSNDYVISYYAIRAPKIVAAWGAEVSHFPERERRVIEILRRVAVGKVQHLGLTAGGHPRHPLFLPTDAELSDLPGIDG